MSTEQHTEAMAKKTIQIVGSFISNYSLARVNRGFVKALSEVQDEYEVSIFREKEKIDRWPTEKDLAQYPYIKNLWQQTRKEVDIAIYNDYPKTGHTQHGLKDLPGRIKFMYLAWEESVYPKMWVDEINENLHGVMVSSSFVRNTFRKAGVKVPIAVVPNAIDSAVHVAPTGTHPLKTKKTFKFFHLSTGRKRKGIDVLLKAYFESFSKDDDVCLVIKSFPGPDNMVNELLSKLQSENSPEVEHIFDSEMTDQEMVNLIASCDCAVYPSRAEGFGLPIAEAMYHGLPVIATNYSAYLDFIDNESGFLVDYELKDAIDSEMVNVGAKWAEPSVEDLKEKMSLVFKAMTEKNPKFEIQNPKQIQNSNVLNIKQIVTNARKNVESLTWENSARTAMEFIKEVESIAHLKTKKIGVVGRVNSEDGVAEYTTYIYSPIEQSFQEFYYIANKDIDDRVRADAENVVRTWNVGEESFEDTLTFIKEKGLDIIHIQYHSGFNFSVQALDTLIQKLVDHHIEVYVTMHAVRSDSFDFIKEAQNLSLAQAVFIHNQNDFEHARKSLRNVVLFRIPTLKFTEREKTRLQTDLGLTNFKPIIASHGLMNSNKNIPSVVEAFVKVKEYYKDALLLLINAVSGNNLASSGEFQRAQDIAKQQGIEDSVIFVTDFLEVKQIEVLLQVADLLVLAYREVGETSSDAVRKCLCTHNPTMVTDIKQFSEFTEEVYKIASPEVSEIAKGILFLLSDTKLQEKLRQNAKKFVEQNSYEKRSINMIQYYKNSPIKV